MPYSPTTQQFTLLFENAPWDEGDLWHTEVDLLKGPISATKRSQGRFCDRQRGRPCRLTPAAKYITVNRQKTNKHNAILRHNATIPFSY